MTSVGDPMRRSALLLHALCPADRQWVLDRLAGVKRDALRGLLHELAELGIPADRELIEPYAKHERARAVAGIPTCPEAASDVGFRQLCAVVSQADPARLALLLREEPPQLIAGFIQLSDWPWRESLIQQLGPLRRKQVGELLLADGGKSSCPERAGAARMFLLKSVVRRLDAGAGRPLSGRGAGQAADSTGGYWVDKASSWFRGRGRS
jgi:hypothetical protein